jgi:hypothetical protein
MVLKACMAAVAAVAAAAWAQAQPLSAAMVEIVLLIPLILLLQRLQTIPLPLKEAEQEEILVSLRKTVQMVAIKTVAAVGFILEPVPVLLLAAMVVLVALLLVVAVEVLALIVKMALQAIVVLVVPVVAEKSKLEFMVNHKGGESWQQIISVFYN